MIHEIWYLKRDGLESVGNSKTYAQRQPHVNFSLTHVLIYGHLVKYYKLLPRYISFFFGIRWSSSIGETLFGDGLGFLSLFTVNSDHGISLLYCSVYLLWWLLLYFSFLIAEGCSYSVNSWNKMDVLIIGQETLISFSCRKCKQW